MEAVESVEPLSTTMISDAGMLWRFIDLMQVSMVLWEFLATIITVLFTELEPLSSEL